MGRNSPVAASLAFRETAFHWPDRSIRRLCSTWPSTPLANAFGMRANKRLYMWPVTSKVRRSPIPPQVTEAIKYQEHLPAHSFSRTHHPILTTKSQYPHLPVTSVYRSQDEAIRQCLPHCSHLHHRRWPVRVRYIEHERDVSEYRNDSIYI